MGKTGKILLSIARWIGFILLGLLALFLIIVLLIRTPWAQQKITNYATSYVSDKTGTAVTIERLFVTFTGNVQLEGLYLEGLHRDTLLYSNSLEAGVGLRSLISGNIHISKIDWDGLNAHITKGKDSTFNFHFIMEALAAGPDTTAAPKDTGTASGPPEISVGPVNLTNFRITYLDSISGIDGYLRLGELSLTTDDLDPEAMKFAVDELALKNTSVRVVQFLNPPPSDDTAETAMPFISWEEILLENVALHFRTEPDTLDANALISHFLITESELALAEQRININTIELLRSNFQVKLPAPDPDNVAAASADDNVDTTGFRWPQWQVELKDLRLAENDIRFDRGSGSATPGFFDPDHLAFEDLMVELNEVTLAENSAALTLQELSFAERSGFTIEDFHFKLSLRPEQLELNNLRLKTAHSLLATQLQLRYQSIDSLLANAASESRIDLMIEEETSLSLLDAFYFNDSLSQDSLMQELAPFPIQIAAAVEGRLSDLTIENLEINALQSTRMSLRGRIAGLPDTSALEVAIPALNLYTTDADLALFMDTSASHFPEYVQLQASLNGSLQQLKTNLELTTPEGNLTLRSRLRDLLKVPAYQGEMEVNNLAVGPLIGNPDLGPLTMNLSFDGQGTTPENLELDTDIDFQKLTYKSYDYSDLKLQAQVNDQKANLKMSHADSNLNFNLLVEALLDNERTVADLQLNLAGADLQDLNLATSRTKIALGLKASFTGSPSDFRSSVNITNGIFIRGETTQRLDSLHASLANDSSQSRFEVSSDIIQGKVEGNTSIQTLVSSLQTYLARAMGSDSLATDTAYSDLDMSGNFVITNSPILTDFLLPGLTRMDSISIETAFQPAADKLMLKVRSPEIVYQKFDLENLRLDVNTTGDSTFADLSFDRFSREPLDMHKTHLQIDLAGQQGTASLSVLSEQEIEVFFTSLDIQREGETTILKVDPNHLTLNGNPWNIPSGNSIRLEEEQTIFEQFVLNRDQQQVAVQSFRERDEMQISFDGLRLQSIFSIFNADQSPVSGMLNGEVTLMNLSQTPAFVADVSLNELEAMGNPVGKLTVQADNQGQDQFDLSLSLQGEQIDLIAEGGYTTAGATQNVDIKFDLNKLGLKLIEGFIPEQIDSARGYLSGNFDISGSPGDPQFDGLLTFHEAGLTPVLLGTDIRLDNSEIKANNEGINLDRFTLIDARGNKTTFDGRIGLESMINPTFDLEVEANEFRLLESTREENERFYGTAVLDLDLSIDGDLNLPVIEARVKMLNSTDVAYVIPISQAQIESRQGIVRFENMKDSVDVLSQEEDEAAGVITGFDVSAYIELAEGTRFTVVVDPQSGDNLTVVGEADLNLNLSPNGNMTLTGSYEVNDGSYQLNLYELVKKKFDLLDGSRIVWTGDPTGADLDLTAVYRTETSPASLMADPSMQYRQSIPFEVLLFIDGTINEPRISFGLDMPEDSRGVMGGSVYGRIRQLNENEAELNKQVFSLIVFDRFLPDQAVADDGSGNSDLARSSVSKLLTGQLNKLADQYIKGVELNVDVDSYADYQSQGGQQQTDLNVSLRKAFFDERVVVEVGSEVGIEGQRKNSEVIGDVSVEYLLTEEGTYRLRAFRNNQFQNLVEGQVIITGLGILFNKQFDTWKELWKSEQKQMEEELQNNPDPKATKEEEEEADPTEEPQNPGTK